MYTYKAKVTKVVDGDTIDCVIDLGFDIHVKKRVRFLGINAPESRTRNLDEKKVGLYVKHVVDTILSEADYEIILSTSLDETGKYGRVLGTIYLEEMDLNERLVEMKLASPYVGGQRLAFGTKVSNGLLISPEEVPEY